MAAARRNPLATLPLLGLWSRRPERMARPIAATTAGGLAFPMAFKARLLSLGFSSTNQSSGRPINCAVHAELSAGFTGLP